MLNNHANRPYFLALVAVLFLGALPFVPAFHAHVRRPNAIAAPPPPPVRPVTDEYFGVKVVDPYRYMEDLKDPQVVATRAVLSSIPGRDPLLTRIKVLDEGATARISDVRRLPGR